MTKTKTTVYNRHSQKRFELEKDSDGNVTTLEPNSQIALEKDFAEKLVKKYGRYLTLIKAEVGTVDSQEKVAFKKQKAVLEKEKEEFEKAKKEFEQAKEELEKSKGKNKKSSK